MAFKVLKSKEEDSVNFVFGGNYSGFFEARYVRRSPKYFAVYLSSQSGCKQACQMCHLTATGQIAFVNASFENYLEQALEVFRYYDLNTPKAEIVHFNFMSRGEAFDNPLFLACGKKLFHALEEKASDQNLFPRFLISTMMPKSFSGQSLSKLFPSINPEIYYSIYGAEETFRKRWLPKAMPIPEALKMLNEYQANTKKIIKLHWAFIEGENDGERDVAYLCHIIRSSGLRVDIAIVRYNPYSEKYGRESSDEVINRNEEILKTLLPFSKVKKITRVGKDVKASCGMFIEPK